MSPHVAGTLTNVGAGMAYVASLYERTRSSFPNDPRIEVSANIAAYVLIAAVMTNLVLLVRQVGEDYASGKPRISEDDKMLIANIATTAVLIGLNVINGNISF